MKQTAYPLNSLERHILAIEREDFAFNSHLIMDLRSPLDLPRARAAFARMCGALPLLRSRLEGLPLTAIRKTVSELWYDPQIFFQELESVDVASLSAELNRPFDPTIEPPLRLYYGPFAGGYRLIMTSHHVAIDGMGQAFLLNEFFHAYEGVDFSAWAQRDSLLRFRHLFFRIWGFKKTLKLFFSSLAYLLTTRRPRAASLLDHPEKSLRQTRMIEIPLGSLWTEWDRRATALGLQGAFEFLLYTVAEVLDQQCRRRGESARPIVFAVPLNFRPFFRLNGYFQNYAGLCKLVIPRAKIGTGDFAPWLRQQIEKDLRLQGALPSIYLGALGGMLFSFKRIRRWLLKNDLNPKSIYSTVVISVGRLPRSLDYPPSLAIERVYGFGSLTKSPGLGIVITGEKDKQTMTVSYLEGLIDPQTLETFVSALTARIRNL